MKRSSQKRITKLRKERQVAVVAEARRLRLPGLDKTLMNTEWYGAPDRKWRAIYEAVRRARGRIYVGDLIETRVGLPAVVA